MEFTETEYRQLYNGDWKNHVIPRYYIVSPSRTVFDEICQSLKIDKRNAVRVHCVEQIRDIDFSETHRVRFIYAGARTKRQREVLHYYRCKFPTNGEQEI